MLFAEPTKGPFIFKTGGAPAKKSEYESATSLQKFFECPVSYHNWYASKFREPASKELIFGRAWHLTLDNALTERAINGLMMHPTALEQRFEQWMLIETFYSGKEIEWKGVPGQSFEDFVRMGTALIQLWRHDYLPYLMPRDKGKGILVEANFWLPLKGCKRAIAGKIDLITNDGKLVDHKTSSHTWEYLQASKFYKPAEIALQMGIYHAAYEDLVKDWPQSCELHRAITGDVTEIERIELNYSPEEVQKLFDKKIKPAVREIEQMWEADYFECRCKKHKLDTITLPATAARPLAVTADGAAAGTTEGSVDATVITSPDKKLVAQKLREELLSSRAPLPPVEEVPF